MRLFKDPNFAVFAISSFLIFFPAMFYWSFANLYLNEFPTMNAAQAWQSSGQMAEVIFLVAMPFFFVRFGVKIMLLIGMFAWIARFICFSFGDWGTELWILVFAGLLLHGPCYDFFFVTGQLYTDKKADKSIRSQAQGLNFLITFGLGWFLGSNLAGMVVEKYATEGGHDWHTIWLWPIGMTAALIGFFIFFFRDDTKVAHVEGESHA